jgi:hypothetical protein
MTRSKSCLLRCMSQCMSSGLSFAETATLNSHVQDSGAILSGQLSRIVAFLPGTNSPATPRPVEQIACRALIADGDRIPPGRGHARQVYAFAWGCIERGQPEAAAAAVICFEWLQRLENVLAGFLRWTDYRSKEWPSAIKIEHHKTGAGLASAGGTDGCRNREIL